MTTVGRLLRSGIAWCRKTLRYDLRQEVAQNSLIVLVGHMVRLALGLISSALLARGLGPEGLSVFSVLSVTMMIGLTVADFGLSHSAVRQIAGDLKDAPAQARQTAGTFTRFKLVGGLLVVGLIAVFATPIARVVNLPPESGTLLIRIASLGLLANVLSGTTASVLHALRRFGVLVITQSVNIGLTVLLMAGLFIVGRLTIVPALLIGVVGAIVAAVLGFVLLSPDWRTAMLSEGKFLNDESRRLLDFSKWLWISAILSILSTQLDLLLLNRWMAPQIVGFYALALNLSHKAGIINQTLHVVLLPTASALSTRDAYITYVRRNLTRSLLIGLLLLFILPAARPFILRIYGIEYAASVSVFYFLMAVVLFDLVATPILLLAFPLDMPRLIAAANGIRVAVLIATGGLFIPIWGMQGAVLAKLAAKIAGAVVTAAVIAMRLRTDSAPIVNDTMPDSHIPSHPVSTETE